MSDVINRRDLDFLLFEVLGLADLCNRPRYADHSADTLASVLDVAQRLAEEQFAPHAAKLDANEPVMKDGKVYLIPEVAEALDAFVESGFLSAAFDEELGGMQMPYLSTQAAAAMFIGANIGTAAYPFLTQAAANLLIHCGSPSQIERFVSPMLSGAAAGTMCLSEPGAGSSLGDIRCKALPREDGHYDIVGDKMWISCGEHELNDNIVHLVLAKTPNAPAGVKGISLFIVPRYTLDENGAPAAENGVKLTGLNHKMGSRGTVNCVLSFGDDTSCVGELIGEEHRGIVYMFHMMNEARIAVGLASSMSGYAAYLHALQYAKERPQGRHPDDRSPDSEPVAIIEHADVKRMLLAQKSYVEGGLHLSLYASRLVDDIKTATDPDKAAHLGLLLDFLTPIVKAWPSDYCLKANELAIQVLGGYGYTREYPVERHYRDNRLNAIHEGTNGIQAIDLLGRKAIRNNGAGLRAAIGEVLQTCASVSDEGELAPFKAALMGACETISGTTIALGQCAMKGEIRRFLANASAYLEMVGLTVVAWMWLDQARVATAALAAGGEQDAAFYRGKIRACRYFFVYELPKIKRLSKLLVALDDTCLSMPVDEF